jgi:predicted RNase H-like HicB family nuclease
MFQTSGCTRLDLAASAAIRFHIEGLKAEGLEVPAPTSIADYVEA